MIDRIIGDAGWIGLQRLAGALAQMDNKQEAEVYRVLMEDAPGYIELPAPVRVADMTLTMEEGVRALKKIVRIINTVEEVFLPAQTAEAQTVDTPDFDTGSTKGNHCHEHHRAAQGPGIPDQFSRPGKIPEEWCTDGQGAQDNQP